MSEIHLKWKQTAPSPPPFDFSSVAPNNAARQSFMQIASCLPPTWAHMLGFSLETKPHWESAMFASRRQRLEWPVSREWFHLGRVGQPHAMRLKGGPYGCRGVMPVGRRGADQPIAPQPSHYGQLVAQVPLWQKQPGEDLSVPPLHSLFVLVFRRAKWGNPLNIFSVSDSKRRHLIARESVDNSGASVQATSLLFTEVAAGGRQMRNC